MAFHELLERMRDEWDARARENGKHYIANCREDWSEEDFYRSGEQTLAQEILTDMYNVCQGKAPVEMSVLEIGCGAGRVTRALAGVFGEVHAVDVSGEMVLQARKGLEARPNAFVYQNNGADLSVLGDRQFDFAFSTCVFHHIGSLEVIETYVREVHRLLRSGGLFKFEVQGFLGMAADKEGTWFGLPFSDEDAVAMAERCGFEARYRVGAGEERFWLWYFKK
ncbi:MAG: class I SAM-dependent methyltransferase [Bryobacterales bacterium]|nr:class I SAM-dependent methyltransferase [Bryobacterales bacterium]